MRTVWLAQVNTDSTEGRGPMKTIAAFDEERDAAIATHGMGVMGVGNGEAKPLLVYSSVAEWRREKDRELRNMALAKLTAEEKAVLGVN